MAYNKLIDLNLLSNFLNKIKSLIPTKTSDLENDSEYITGMEILSYGNSTWNDFLTAYTAKKVVYCRASSNSNPASGSQTRLAFMAYVNNADNPTNVEFQYYRSVSSHTSTQQGDQVFVYKLDKTSGWSVTTREASSKIVAGTNMTSSYSSDTLTLNANIPSNVSDLTNDSGYITGITSSDVTTALGYTPSNVELLNNYRTITEQNEIDDAQDERFNTVEQATTATTISSAIITTFDASAADMPLKELTVNIEPVQTGSGDPSPDNVRPFTGWTGCKLHRTGISLIGGDAFVGYAFAKTDSGYELTYGGSGVSQRGSAYADITGLPAGLYTLQFINYTCPDGGAVTFRFRSPGGSWTTFTIIGGSAFGRRSFTMPANAAQIQFYFSPNTASVGDKLTADDVVLMREEDDETPEPYKGNTYDITFPSPDPGTVYGGTLDVMSGKLSVNFASLTLPNADSIRDSTADGTGKWVRYSMPQNTSVNDDTVNAIGEKLKGINRSSTEYRAAWTMQTYTGGANNYLAVFVPADYTLEQIDTAIADSQIVYKLNIPIIYDLSDAPEITTLLGENNIWADCGNVTVIYGEYLTQIKNNINNLDKRVKIIEDNDQLFDKLIHLPNDDSFFNKGTVTSAGVYTKLSKNSFSLSGGSGTSYYSYPLHGTNRIVYGSNTQLPTRLLATDFVEIPANGVWGNTTYSLGIQFYCEANTTSSNRNLELVLVCANIQNGEIVGTPEIVNNYITNNKEYGSTILRLRGFGYAPLERYTHYAIFARSRSRASSAVATMTLKLVQSPRLLQYILYSDNVAETSLTATATHDPNSFILNNDRLYKVLTQIQAGEEIVAGTNVTQVSILEVLTSLLNNTENIPNTSSISNTGLISIKHDSTELFTIQLPLYNGGVSNGT